MLIIAHDGTINNYRELLGENLPISEIFGSLATGQILAPTGANLVIAEWTAPGTPPHETPEWIAPLHTHHNDDEAWYVLEGTLGFQVGDHTIRSLIDAIHRTENRDAETMKKLFEQYESELL